MGHNLQGASFKGPSEPFGPLSQAEWIALQRRNCGLRQTGGVLCSPLVNHLLSSGPMGNSGVSNGGQQAAGDGCFDGSY